MIAEIITIGDELLIGQVTNTNASWLGENLLSSGILIKRVNVISDEKEEIQNTLNECLSRSQIVIITGGLGPTKDDITKNTLTDFFKTRLVVHQPTLNHLEKLFKARGFKSNKLNKKQAEIPENCIPLFNSKGTAPGMWFEENNKLIISVPGVPIEMKSLIREEVIPRLKKKFDLPVRVYKTVMIHSLPESLLAQKLEKWENNLPDNIKVAYLPKPRILRLRIGTEGISKLECLQSIQLQIDKLYPIIGDHIFGFDGETLSSAIGKILTKDNKSLSTAESCTGGNIGSQITSVAGSSAYFKGGIISYSDEIKIKVLGVKESSIKKYGAVSEIVVQEMAIGVQDRLQTDYAISVSGIAGPGGGSEEKPVGTTWIGIATPEQVYAKKFQLGEDRERNINRATTAALSMLYDIVKVR